MILAVLDARPSNGWGVVRAITDIFDGAYEPSPGAVYPAIEALAAEGLIAGDGERGPSYSLRRSGREALEARREELAAIEVRTGILLSPGSPVDAAVDRVASAARREARGGRSDEVVRLLDRTCRQLSQLSGRTGESHA